MTRTRIITLIASASIAGAALVPAVSQAQPVGNGGAAASCTYKGSTTSDGGVVLQDDGIYYKCVNGSWVYDHKKATLLAPPSKGGSNLHVAATTSVAPARLSR